MGISRRLIIFFFPIFFIFLSLIILPLGILCITCFIIYIITLNYTWDFFFPKYPFFYGMVYIMFVHYLLRSGVRGNPKTSLYGRLQDFLPGYFHTKYRCVYLSQKQRFARVCIPKIYESFHFLE